jgi:hypothetical protein
MQPILALLMFYCHKWPCALIIAVVTAIVGFLLGYFRGKSVAGANARR